LACAACTGVTAPPGRRPGGRRVRHVIALALPQVVYVAEFTVVGPGISTGIGLAGPGAASPPEPRLPVSSRPWAGSPRAPGSPPVRAPSSRSTIRSLASSSPAQRPHFSGPVPPRSPSGFPDARPPTQGPAVTPLYTIASPVSCGLSSTAGQPLFHRGFPPTRAGGPGDGRARAGLAIGGLAPY
ncbi:MAG: hypothetical protein OXR67_01745, partial [Chloroflexota bacterium]|nr:hypothetical protein [Chloroflexota bacterium]